MSAERGVLFLSLRMALMVNGLSPPRTRRRAFPIPFATLSILAMNGISNNENMNVGQRALFAKYSCARWRCRAGSMVYAYGDGYCWSEAAARRLTTCLER